MANQQGHPLKAAFPFERILFEFEKHSNSAVPEMHNQMNQMFRWGTALEAPELFTLLFVNATTKKRVKDDAYDELIQSYFAKLLELSLESQDPSDTAYQAADVAKWMKKVPVYAPSTSSRGRASVRNTSSLVKVFNSFIDMKTNDSLPESFRDEDGVVFILEIALLFPDMEKASFDPRDWRSYKSTYIAPSSAALSRQAVATSVNSGSSSVAAGSRTANTGDMQEVIRKAAKLSIGSPVKVLKVPS